MRFAPAEGKTRYFLHCYFYFSSSLSLSLLPLGCQALSDQVEQAWMTAQQALAGMHTDNFSLPKDFSSWYTFQNAKAMECIYESTCRARLVLSSDSTDLTKLCIIVTAASVSFLAPANFTSGLHWRNLLCGACSCTAFCNLHAALIPRKRWQRPRPLLFSPHPLTAHSREQAQAGVQCLPFPAVSLSMG